MPTGQSKHPIHVLACDAICETRIPRLARGAEKGSRNVKWIPHSSELTQRDVSTDHGALFSGRQHPLPTFSHNNQNPSPSSTVDVSENLSSDERWLDLEPLPLITVRFSESWTMADAVLEYATVKELFEQLSTWYGLDYTAPGIRTISQFYDEKNMPGEFIAMTEIQRQVGRFVIALDGHACDSLAISLIPQFIHDFDALKVRYSKVWSFATEINMQASKLYMFAMCLITTDHSSLKSMKDTEAVIFLHKVLQWGHEAAIALVNLVARASDAKNENPSCGSYEDGGSPILATPKQHFRLAFFACCFLLKYLDTGTASAADRDSARNAVSTLFHQTFMRFPCQPQLVRAAAIIEVLGRAIVPDRGRLVAHVRSRLGASLMYNATWTAAELRGRRNDHKPTPTPSQPPLPQIEFTPISTANMGVSYINPENHNGTILTDLDLQMSQNSSFEYQFPWGVWNDALFDALEIGSGSQFYDSSLPMYNFI
ncbi:hypothetical protein FKW77_009584 [Venturia effusa]|uniref:Uncharacterized protein n=1 Tax=Venturia effusa TaxID=50376 RepID=A0A517L218_9PEZI|nr:hypothetical protein FKW77_009584 [Venturia effusa]